MSDETNPKPLHPMNDGDPATQYQPMTTIPVKRELAIKRPGNINYAANGGSYPGSRVLTFYDGGKVDGLEAADRQALRKQAEEDGMTGDNSAAAYCNLYFKHRANLLTVAVIPDCGALIVLYTNHLEDEELEYFQRHADEVAKVMAKWEEDKAARLEAERLEADRKAKENEVLIELGRKVRDHNLIQKARDLEKENEQLKKRLARLETEK